MYPNDEGGIAWNDPDIGIAWQGIRGSAVAQGYSLIDGTPLNLSEKDQNQPRLKDIFPLL